MMLLPLELAQHAAAPAAQALIAGLWQGIALALVTGIVLKFLPGTTASTRFAVWSAVFCASAAMPLAHLLTSTTPQTSAPSSHLVFDPRWSYLLAGLWLGASILRSLKLLAEAASLRKLWREAPLLAPEALESAGLQDSLAGRNVRICTTPDVDRPSVIGFFAPKILIPDWLAAQLSPTELRHIVLHEMEHLRRRDDWLNLLQKIGLVLFPLNPAMFWIDRRLSTEREIACDDGVLARTQTPRAYAASLTSVAERRLNLNARRRMVALALGIFGAGKLFARRSEFSHRIESILGQRTASRPAIAAVLVAAIIGGSAAIVQAPELVSFRATSSEFAAATPAPTDAVAKLTTHHAARFENATLRLPVQTVPKQNRPLPSTDATAPVEQGVVAAIPVKATLDAPKRTHPHRAEPQYLLLSAWEQPTHQAIASREAQDDDQSGDIVVPVSPTHLTPVVIRTADGRFFLAPYAAVPTKAGWLFVQL